MSGTTNGNGAQRIVWVVLGAFVVAVFSMHVFWARNVGSTQRDYGERIRANECRYEAIQESLVEIKRMLREK